MKKGLSQKKAINLSELNNSVLQNIKKKRPNLTKLDIEKLFQQSIQLTEVHRKLYETNISLKKDYQKVEQAKHQRQHFISQVQKIVKQKSHELTMNSKNPHQSSWLVLKLHQKIYDLKEEIKAKDKIIKKLNLSKQNQILFRKQIQIECLKQINDFVHQLSSESTNQNNINKVQDSQDQDAQNSNDKQEDQTDQFQEIVWMDDYLQSQKQKIQQLETELQQQERQTKKLLNLIAVKKTQLKKLKEIEKEFVAVQESFIQQKKKKEQKLVDNKTYLSNLIKQRDAQNQKLKLLKQKREKIQNQQTITIKKLQQKLQLLKRIYQQNKNQQKVVKQKSDVDIKVQNTQQWVKRVTLSQVQIIAKNLNLCLSLKGVDQQAWIQQFFKDANPTYSIQNVIQKLSAYPFEMKNQENKKLLARYVVEDSDTGPTLQDLNTRQDAPIIKSILMKLIGPIKVYSQQKVRYYRQELGTKMSKFWSLVQQSVHIKQGPRNLVTRQILQQGFLSAEVELTSQQFDFVVLFLFSWCRDVSRLELNRLGKLKQQGINYNMDSE